MPDYQEQTTNSFPSQTLPMDKVQSPQIGRQPLTPEHQRRETYMRQALALAEEAASCGDVPVGCVIVKDGKVIGRGRNRRQELGDASAHAEIEAIRDACRQVGSWRLQDTELYVTLEPCPMCAGGIINARVKSLFYGAREDKMGCCGSVLNLFEERFNHHPRIYGGILEAPCRQVLQDFFTTLRPNVENSPASD